MLKFRGFTLIEIMVTVAIIAILVAIGYPSYADYVRRGRITEAISGLSSMRVTMERFFQDNRTYTGGCPAAALPPNTAYFTYSCTTTAGPPAGYTVTATGASTMAGFVYTIDQNNIRRTTLAGTTGWNGDGSACWVMKKDGSC